MEISFFNVVPPFLLTSALDLKSEYEKKLRPCKWKAGVEKKRKDTAIRLHVLRT